MMHREAAANIGRKVRHRNGDETFIGRIRGVTDNYVLVTFAEGEPEQIVLPDHLTFVDETPLAA